MALIVDQLSFAYQKHPVLHDISFTAAPGEILTIIGPNGSGKTTLIKCLVGLNKPQSGTLELYSRNVLTMSANARARAIAYVPQRGEVSGISVFDLIALGRRPYISWNIPEQDLALTGKAIEYMGLKDLAFRSTNEISGGEFQIAAITRAFVQEPELIALDEPTSNLDIKNQCKVMLKIRALVRSHNLIAVMTNHDINLSIRYSDKFVLLKEGRIYAAGSHSIITPHNIKAVYGIDANVEIINGFPVVIPSNAEDLEEDNFV